jgi:sporulation protein YlmC with PRC-barrel domain
MSSQFGTVRTLKEAQEIYKRKVKENKGSTVGVTVPYSGEQMAAAYFSKPEAMIQYADEYGLSGASEPEIIKHYLDNVYEPLAGKKDTAGVKGSMSVNVYNSPGGEAGSRMFGPDEMGAVKISDATVTPLRRITLGADAIKFKANPNTNWIDGKTFKAGQPKNVKTQDMYMQEMYYMPVLIENGKVTGIVKDADVDKLRKQNKRIDYKPYVVVGEESDLTKITNFNFDKSYFVPLESVESNIKNTFGEDKKGKQEFQNWTNAKQNMSKLIGEKLKETAKPK